MGLRYYANAPATTLSASCTNVATTITATATTGFPISYPYTLILDRGLSTEEVVSVTSAAGNVLTVTRGYDSTTAFAHSAGASVQHGFSAIDPREANQHVNNNSGVHGATGSVVGTTDTQTLTNKTLTAPKVDVIKDSNGNSEITFTATGSAVNGITVANAAAAGKPAISATGSDTNISLNLVPKGTGTVQANAVDVVTTTGTQTLTNKTLTTPKIDQINDSNGNAEVIFSTTASATNQITIKNAASGVDPQISATGLDAGVGLNLISKGSATVKVNGAEVATTTVAQTLTNKTLSTGTLVGSATTDISVAWASYTPSLTNITIGNGTISGWYVQIGKTVIGRLKFAAGSTTTYSASTLIFGLPITASSNYAGGVDAAGSSHMHNGTSPTRTIGTAVFNNTTSLFVVSSAASPATVTNTVPFTWGTSSVLSIDFTYEAA